MRESSAARKEYEKAIELFHKRHFDDAARRFEELIEKHPDEKEFLDRARMYLTRVPEREEGEGGRRRPSPKRSTTPPSSRRTAATSRRRSSSSARTPARRTATGACHYLAACCLALQGDAEQALQSLRKAIAADDQNRIQARLEADLSVLRGTQGFTELVAGGA